MKKLLKTWLIISFALVTQNQFWQNLNFQNGAGTIIKVALVLTIFEIFLKPIIRFLLLPINLITFGSIRLIISTIGFYLCLFLLSDFQIQPIATPTQSLFGIIIPEINLSGFWVFLVNSTTTNLITAIYKFILKPNKPKK